MTDRKVTGQEIAATIRSMIGKRAYLMAHYDEEGTIHIVTNIQPVDQLRFLDETAKGMRAHGPIVSGHKLVQPS